jgi:hypothetical protein
MTSFLVLLNFRAKTIIIDEIILPMRNINLLQGASALHVLKLINSLAKEPISIQDANKCATWILDTIYNKADLQSIVRDNCKHLSTNQKKKLLQLIMKYELPLTAP